MASQPPARPPAPSRPTQVVVVDSEKPDADALEHAASVLRNRGLVAFATETVYGLGAIATDPDAVASIFIAKDRPAINPVIVHVASVEQAVKCVALWPDTAALLSARFWPGPLTLVLKRSPLIPDAVTAGQETVAVRMPLGNVARGIIARTGMPIAAPSANRANRISPTQARHVLADLGGRIDLIVDSGPTTIGLESTVLDLSGSRPRVLRHGPISIEELRNALGAAVDECDATEGAARPRSPGQMPIHYAPRTPAFRTEHHGGLGELGPCENIAVLVIGDHETPFLSGFAAAILLRTPPEAARGLYEALHHCDAVSARAIVVVMPPDAPEWRAIRDRLLRATRPLPG
jgi:L-threonylcarbamoyladenylate synthase